MGTRILKFAAATALMALASAQGAAATVTGFRLPPSDSATPAQPEAEGPAAEDIPRSRPRTIEQAPGATPTPSPTPAPGSASGSVSRPVVQELPTQTDTEPGNAPATAQPTPPSARQTIPAPAAEPATRPAAPDSETSEETPTASREAAPPIAASTPAPAPPDSPAAEIENDGTGTAPWIVAVLALLGIAGGAAWWRRRRGGSTPAAKVPIIERPAPLPASPTQEPAPAPATSAGTAKEALRIAITPGKLSLTLMNATLSYQLEVTNSGGQAVNDLRISADMVAAHASLGREQQLGGPAPDMPPQHSIERLEPGEAKAFSGEFRLPLSHILPIRQGSAALMLPLARFRLTAREIEPRTSIFAVGQPGAQPNGALVPFRLDQGPRIYSRLIHRAFA